VLEINIDESCWLAGWLQCVISNVIFDERRTPYGTFDYHNDDVCKQCSPAPTGFCPHARTLSCIHGYIYRRDRRRG